MRNTPLLIRCMVFTGIQAGAFLYLIFNQPYEAHKENIIEVMNEAIFFGLSVIITLLQDKSGWQPGMAQIVMMVIMMNGVLISFVIGIDGIIQLIKQ